MFNVCTRLGTEQLYVQCLYKVGYRVTRYYWSCRRLNARGRYVCSIEDVGGEPEFVVEIHEDGFDDVTIRASSCTGSERVRASLQSALNIYF